VHGVNPSTRTSGRTRNAKALAALATAVLPLLAACSGSEQPAAPGEVPQSTQAGKDIKHGPFFPQCGGISDQTVNQLTQVPGLVNTATTSVGCQWLAGGSIVGPHFSFTHFRGSPIGRERKTEELSRTSVEDINIDGHSGFVALANDPTMGDNLCEVGIQFQDDFIEWSISFNEQPVPPPCDVAKELARQSIANAK
jgi:hypothetical protein